MNTDNAGAADCDRDLTLWQRRSQAPDVGTVLAPLSELPDNMTKEFVFGVGLNAFRMFILRRGESVFGYVNCCPHYSLPLNVRDDEFLSRDGTQIMCRRHLALFSIEDGMCTEGACVGSQLDAIPLTIDTAGRVVIG